MKPHSLVIPMIFATTAAMADADSQRFEPRDAHSQAAALLTTPHAFSTPRAERPGYASSSASATMDAQTRAAALLSRPRIASSAKGALSINRSSSATISAGAQAQAAALLSGTRTNMDKVLRAQRTERNVRTSG
jgi:hypothetical protein